MFVIEKLVKLLIPEFIGYGPAPRANVQLDPIYTRTIKQYDDELINKQPQQRPPQSHSRQQSTRNNDDRYNHHAI